MKMAKSEEIPFPMRLLVLFVLSLIPGCTLLHRKASPSSPPQPVYHIDTALAAALKPAAVSIEIDLSRQEMRLLNADKMAVVVTQISSGRNTTPTPTGDFKVLEKLPTKFSNRYGKFVKPDTREVVVWRTWEHHGPPPPGTRYEGYEMPHWRVQAGGAFQQRLHPHPCRAPAGHLGTRQGRNPGAHPRQQRGSS
jgi:hypothetical protein